MLTMLPQDDVVSIDPELARDLQPVVDFEDEAELRVVERGETSWVDLRDVAEAAEAAPDVVLVLVLDGVARHRHLSQPVRHVKEVVWGFLRVLEHELPPWKAMGLAWRASSRSAGVTNRGSIAPRQDGRSST
jgi:hypothetical protein